MPTNSSIIFFSVVGNISQSPVLWMCIIVPMCLECNGRQFVYFRLRASVPSRNLASFLGIENGIFWRWNSINKGSFFPYFDGATPASSFLENWSVVTIKDVKFKAPLIFVTLRLNLRRVVNLAVGLNLRRPQSDDVEHAAFNFYNSNHRQNRISIQDHKARK